MKRVLFCLIFLSLTAGATADKVKNNVLVKSIEQSNIETFKKSIDKSSDEILLEALKYSLVLEDSRFLQALLKNKKAAALLSSHTDLVALPVQESKLKNLDLLIEAHQEILNTSLSEKRSLLHEAVTHGSIEMIKHLIKKNPSLVQRIDENGESVLFAAARRGERDIAAYLVGLKIDRSLKNKKGQTAAEVALAEDFPKTAAILKAK